MADNYNDLLPDTLLDLPRCENRTALEQLRKTGREFCKRTKAWREDLRPLAAYAEQARYEIIHTFDAYILRLLSVKHKGTDYTPQNKKIYKLSENEDIVFNLGYVPSQDSTDTYSAASTYEEDDIVEYNDLIYVASEDIATPEAFDSTNWEGDTTNLGIEISVIFVPIDGSMELPEWFFEKYYEALVAGARSKLMALAGKPYTNPVEAELNRGVYRYEINQAMNNVAMNETHIASGVRG